MEILMKELNATEDCNYLSYSNYWPHSNLIIKTWGDDLRYFKYVDITERVVNK